VDCQCLAKSLVNDLDSAISGVGPKVVMLDKRKIPRNSETVYEKEFDSETWHPYESDSSFNTNVVVPVDKHLEGFDVVTFWSRNLPECSLLSCNHLAQELSTNSHCLFSSFEEAVVNVPNQIVGKMPVPQAPIVSFSAPKNTPGNTKSRLTLALYRTPRK